MRDYGKVSGKFWTGDTGKALRGDADAQLVALYLMTSPHATMIGVYSLPILYLAHETGLSMEGASKGLARCIEVGFCTYEATSDTVFVIEMAAHQVGDVLKPADNRHRGIIKQYQDIADKATKQAFFARYGVEYGLPEPAQKKRALEGAPKGLPRDHSQEQEQEQEQEGARESSGDDARRTPSGSRLPQGWELPSDWKTWAAGERPDIDAEREGQCFADYWHGVAGAKGRKADWEATWRNWIRRAESRGGGARNGNVPREPQNLPRLKA